MNLIVDIGNTRTKFCISRNNQLEEFSICLNEDLTEELDKYADLSQFETSIISSTESEEFTAKINRLLAKHHTSLLLNSNLKFNFDLDYDTKSTLGPDRIANVAGAKHFFPNATCLVIDLGTCITYDILESGAVYRGGAISPGLNMRFKAMNEHSAKLALEKLKEFSFPGDTTTNSLRNGVFYGILGEIKEFISQTEQSFGEIKVVMTGGDYYHFEKGLKYPTFAHLKLTLWGLHEILQNNN